MVLHKMFARLGIVMIAGGYVVSALAAGDAAKDHNVAISLVAVTQACAEQHPDAGISLEKNMLKEKASLTPEMEKTIKEAATNPVYASEVKESYEFFTTPDGLGLLKSICKEMIATN